MKKRKKTETREEEKKHSTELSRVRKEPYRKGWKRNILRNIGNEKLYGKIPHKRTAKKKEESRKNEKMKKRQPVVIYRVVSI